LNELYEPLIERELDAIAPAARAFAEAHSEEELWIAIARFAVLAYAPSQHSKRAVMACSAARGLGVEWTIECARYAAESRPPWSEPPILDAPVVEDVPDLHEAIAANDRLAAERWLAANLDDAPTLLRKVAKGDALLMLETALTLEHDLGSKGRYALLRMVIHELLAESEHPTESLERLVDRAIETKGAIEEVRAVFVSLLDCGDTSRRSHSVAPQAERQLTLPPARAATGVAALDTYHLARDYAQTLIAHSLASRIEYRRDELLAAVRYNLEHGESYAEWTLA
jgi:hypothetical protein